jgi:peptidoglycan hydrolase-like protein with peptidoglycan-binding domain
MSRPRDFYEGGSTTGQHPARRRLELFVAPTAAEELNAIRLPLVVVACWRLNHVLFDFDSSFVAPETRAELLLLSRTIDANPGSPMAIFGHADPSGDDEYNKRLSGRRARAVHAVLTRDVTAWEDLFSKPMEGDTWGLRSTQRILGFLRHEDGSGPYLTEKATGTFDGATNDAIRAFQADHGLAVDGIAGPHTRKVLYRVYMDAICVGRDRQLVLDHDDFVVGEGAKNGDGAFQGCGELNPVHLLSKADAANLERDERNTQNAPNRRVMIFLFQPGTVVAKGDWPCPKWDAPGAGCHGAFWPDGDARRKSGDEAREYRVDRRTMACRFYDRLAHASPCEGIIAPTVRIRLFDKFGKPMPDVAYEAEFGELSQEGTAVNSFAVIHNVAVPTSIRIRWSKLDADSVSTRPRGFEYEMDVFVDFRDGAREERARRKLNNLGYSLAPTLEENVSAFQKDFGLPTTGRLDDAYQEITRRHDRTLPRADK